MSRGDDEKDECERLTGHVPEPDLERLRRLGELVGTNAP